MPLERERCYAIDHPRAAAGCSPQSPMSEITVDAVWARVCDALGTEAARR